MITVKDQNRTTFRTKVFERDNNLCVVSDCNSKADDAHHLIERRLWTHDGEKGGYIVDNGVSLCNYHHQLAERNILSPQVLRMFAGIKNRILPQQLNHSLDYNKWGNPMKPLKRVYLYENAVKYPSTAYFAFSPNLQQARETNPIISINNLLGYPLIFTIKMDGSNISMSNERVVARNGKDARHRSFDYVKSIQAQKGMNIPKNIQVFGEWLYAKHSIHYKGNNSLKSYFQIFGVYHQEKHIFLGWNEVEEMAKLLGERTVPVLQTTTYNNKHQLEADIIRYGEQVISQGQEGIVVRSVYPFHYSQFPEYMAKYVRRDHVAKGSKHWQIERIVKNEVTNE